MLFLLFAAAASARVMSSLHAVPKGWHHVRQALPDDPVTLRIALQQHSPQVLEQAVLDMSTPGHPNYGMHMTREELQSYAAPSPGSQGAVRDWLAGNGIEPLLRNDWITFTTTTRQANTLLNSSFAWYQYQGGGDPKLRTLSYSVPDHIVPHIDLVQPTTRFGQLGAQKSTIFEMHRVDDGKDISPVANKKVAASNQKADAECGYKITPTCLKLLYNINYTASASPENKVAFASYLEEYARYDDFKTFQEAFVSKAFGQNFTVELINGGLNDQHSLDDSGTFLLPPLPMTTDGADICQPRRTLTCSTSLALATRFPSSNTARVAEARLFPLQINPLDPEATSPTLSGSSTCSISPTRTFHRPSRHHTERRSSQSPKNTPSRSVT